MCSTQISERPPHWRGPCPPCPPLGGDICARGGERLFGSARALLDTPQPTRQPTGTDANRPQEHPRPTATAHRPTLPTCSSGLAVWPTPNPNRTNPATAHRNRRPQGQPNPRDQPTAYRSTNRPTDAPRQRARPTHRNTQPTPANMMAQEHPTATNQPEQTNQTTRQPSKQTGTRTDQPTPTNPPT